MGSTIHADDARLAADAATGDEGAFATLYVRHERPVYNYCLRVTGNETDAADATQEAFAGVFDRLTAGGEPIRNIEGYLFAAARHAALGISARSRRAIPAADVEAAAGDWMLREPANPAEDPERAALMATTAEEVHAANAQLPMRQREALALREIGELSYDEIARLMGTNANAVAQLLSRARLGLLRELRGASLASFAVASGECARALPLLGQDAGALGAADAEFLGAHLEDCPTCRLSAAALEEVGTSYRAWYPLAPVGLLAATKSAWASGLAAHGVTGAAAGGGVPVAAGGAARSFRPRTAVLSGLGAVILTLLAIVAVSGLTGDDEQAATPAVDTLGRTTPPAASTPRPPPTRAVPTPSAAAASPPADQPVSEAVRAGYAGEDGQSQLEIGP